MYAFTCFCFFVLFKKKLILSFLVKFRSFFCFWAVEGAKSSCLCVFCAKLVQLKKRHKKLIGLWSFADERKSSNLFIISRDRNESVIIIFGPRNPAQHSRTKKKEEKIKIGNKKSTVHWFLSFAFYYFYVYYYYFHSPFLICDS